MVEQFLAIADLLAHAQKYDKILILGGTSEAAELANLLTEYGCNVTSSLAGRTKQPRPVKGALRVGGFGGSNGLTSYLRDQNCDLMIDATHPFAKKISANAETASQLSGVKLLKFLRPLWQKQKQDIWISAPNIVAAREAIPANARVLLALGRQYIEPFASRTDVHFIIRMVDQPDTKLPFQSYDLIIGKPSMIASDEADTMRLNKVSHIICRNSGGSGAYAKIEAARMLKIPVIIVEQN